MELGSNFKFTQATLERFRYFLKQRLTVESAAPLMRPETIQVFAGQVGDALEVAMRGELFGEVLDRREFSAPADWVQAVKERIYQSARCPRWLKRRWGKVRYRCQVLDVRAIYPELTQKVSLPREAFQIKIHVMSDGTALR